MFKTRIIDYITYSGIYRLNFYNQKNSFLDLDGVRAEKNRKKTRIILGSISSVNGKIGNANYILNEVKNKLQDAINNWNNANALLKESIEELALAI
ncbi:hypothetical protein [Borreliella garinii]|uniref:hypothetical protein n=1 Tax=Borreliella garinii TaxID=29519 RepID=UPI001F36ADB5|nr:hypothetical protein [Borreliella garinii]WNZ67131.1 hypothetical protein PT139_04685 [Borreliella garinii]WNZ68131.1 hypothetical protein PT135_04695 [Borreliella garinii]WNZ69129.1 hypothetical protein PT138_04700 [Borreliella garinii]WNZ70130.1 hypothetical protein PT140_04685 [Borreliella garinii]WNZ71131.1 hypothetical protein PT141_04705 [Borreliella garinii]